MSMLADDEDEWMDLEKPGKAVAELPPAQVRLSKRSPDRKASAYLALRREFAEWARDKGPRFRLQVGGAAANKVRIIPDMAGGKFEAGMFRGTARLTLGHGNLWPDEAREPIEATASIDASGALVLVLPESFARRAAAPAPQPLPVKPPAPVKPAAFPITTTVHGLASSLDFPALAAIGRTRMTPGEQRVLGSLLKGGEVSKGALRDLFGCAAGGVQLLADSLVEKLKREGYRLTDEAGFFRLSAGDLKELRAMAETRR